MTASRTIAAALGSIWLVGAVACGAARHRPDVGSPARRDAIEPPRAASRGDHIPSSDLAKVRGTTAADAVRQLRPEFLRAGGRRMSPSAAGATPSVYVNGRYAGDAAVLSLIPLRVVIDVRHLDAVAAKSLLGSSCPCAAGVIFIRTR